MKKKSRPAAEAEPRSPAAAQQGVVASGHGAPQGRGVHPTYRPSPPYTRSRADRYPIQKWGSENFCREKGVCLKINKHCVYRHTSPEGKVYIGTTSQDPEKRWRGGLGYADNLHFLADILDFGWRNFEHEILLSGLTAEEAYRREAELIQEYNSTDPQFGYNLSAGQPKKRVTSQTRKAREQSSSAQKSARAVRCVETGEVYPSASAVANMLGVDRSSLRKQIRRGQSCHGYHWEYTT